MLAKEKIALALKGRKAEQVEAIFCFYAAATFCREHEGGIWTWETVFKPLGIMTPQQSDIANWVVKGLDWWCRALIIGRNGDRRLLTTIACEGGLPLQLLQKESAAINQFFRAVLENYHAQGCGGLEMAESLSCLQAHRLPVSLQQDVVFHLGGELITAVVELQREIGVVPNAILALDEKVPDWRNRLPLRLEEQTAELLFKGLVNRSGELVRAASARLRWRGKLKQTAMGWRVEKWLELPEKISAEQIGQWLGQTSIPPRLRLLLTTLYGTEVIAWLTLSGGSGETACYRREWIKRGGLSLIDSAVMEIHSLSLHDGQNEYPLIVQNGEPWGELPWLFVEKNTTGDLEFLGEGSAKTPAKQAWVLVPETLMIKAHETSCCEKLGNHLALKRIAYRVSGTVDFLTTEQERYRLVCQAANESIGNYSIVGKTLNAAINPNPVYLGLPRILNNTAHYKTQWRPVNNGSGWREGDLDSTGRLWLRLLNVAEGIEVFRRQVFVLPKSFRSEAMIGDGDTPGGYCLYGLMGASATIASGQQIVKIADGLEIVCPLLQITSLPTLSVNLHWSTGSLAIHLPYPQRGAVFQLAGQMLQRDDCIPLDRLGGLRLLLQDHLGGQGYRLQAELITANEVDAGLPRLRFSDHLPALDSGRCDTTLLVWQERIASLLNSSRSLDAHVQLDVSSAQGECLARLRIARFDCFIEPNYPAYQISLSADNLTRLGSDWQQRVRLEMIPLWSPSSPPQGLEVNSERDACWTVPNNLQSGPWWIIGRDGDWARFRPLLWVVSNRDTMVAEQLNDSMLASAICEPCSEQRAILLAEVLQALGQNSDHPDWSKLFELIRLSQEFPASSLDVLTRLVTFPQTLALTLLKADENLFTCVWDFAEQMPFSWSLLSVHCWLEAATLHFQSLQAALGEFDVNGEIVFGIFQQFRERTTSRRDYWAVLCDWLQERIFRDRPLQDNSLQVARLLPDFIEEQIGQSEQELQGRHNADEHWPQSDEIMQRIEHNFVDLKYQYQRLSTSNRTGRCLRSVRCAPFVTARLSINGIVSSNRIVSEFEQTEWVDLRQLQQLEHKRHCQIISDNLIYELRLLRSFDAEWFDRVYTLALTLELSRLSLEST